MLANTCNPRTQEMEQEDPELQASRGYTPRPCGARGERRDMKNRGEKGGREEKEDKKVRPGEGSSGMKLLKA